MNKGQRVKIVDYRMDSERGRQRMLGREGEIVSVATDSDGENRVYEVRLDEPHIFGTQMFLPVEIEAI